jgi:CRP-like cAMP-binding protein
MTDLSSAALALFLKRLLLRSQLSDDEQTAVLRLKTRSVQPPPRRDIVSPGQIVHYSCLVASGWVGRFDQMRDGRRQITAFHIAGDMCDLHSAVAPTPGWGITALGEATILQIAHADLLKSAVDFPNLALAYWRDTTADASILSKWIANIGRASAEPRVAHLLCELAIRVENADLGSRASFDLRLTQEQIGDATGLTSVHVNRMLHNLRSDGCISISNHAVKIIDWKRLCDLAAFDPAYLLLNGPTKGRQQL